MSRRTASGPGARGLVLSLVVAATVSLLAASLLGDLGSGPAPLSGTLALKVHAPGDAHTISSCGHQNEWAAAPLQSIEVNQSSCQFATDISYHQFASAGTAPNGSAIDGGVVLSYSLSFALDSITEFSSSGVAVAVTSLPAGPTNYSSASGPSGRTFTDNVSELVTTPSGGALPGEDDWAAVALILQFPPANEEMRSVELTMDVTSWPWYSNEDHLGLALGATAESGADFSWNASSSELSESLEGATSLAGIQVGASADASGGTALIVTTTPRIDNDGSYPSTAHLFLNFTGGGGYSAMTYDPNVLLSTAPFSAVTANPIDLEWVVGAVVAGVMVSAVMAVIAVRIRRHDSDDPAVGLRSSAPVDSRSQTSRA